MSTGIWFDVSIPVRADVGFAAIAAWFKEHDADYRGFVSMINEAGGFVFRLRAGAAGQTYRALMFSFGGDVGHSTASDADDCIKALAVAVADWSHGAMTVYEYNEGFEDGPAEWFYGPAKVVLEAALACRTEQLVKIENEMVELREKLATASDDELSDWYK